MRIAVAGATGRIGGLTVAALERGGHQPVPISRSAGVDAYTGTGLDAALQGVDAVIDSTNVSSSDRAEIVDFFSVTTRNLLAAGERAGVRHTSSCPSWASTTLSPSPTMQANESRSAC